YLKPGGVGIIAIKSQSIDVALEPEEVFSKQMSVLENNFGLKVLENSTIDPFEKKHAVMIVKKD
ncbi:MAG: fibrillarin-like rRNA/tRNA 2'-O-methyltransferase, partial [Candidatus Hodarchaeales archaeon]